MRGGATGRASWRAAMAVLALAGCSSPEPGAFPEPPQPKAAVSEITASLTLPLPGPGGAFAAADRARASRFLDAYRDGGRGPLLAVIAAPGRAAASAAAAALAALAAKRGLPAGALVVSSAVGAVAGVTLRYTDYVAAPPGCDPEIVFSRKAFNEVSPNFGCATENSIAAMLAHPADLLGPPPATAADGARAGRVIDLYRQGKATQADVNRNDDLKASEVGAGGGGGGK